MANPLTEKIRGILSPVLGEFIADSAIRVNCERIGVTNDTLATQQLTEFAEKIKITLFIFLSEKKAREVVQKIKKIKG